MTFLVEDGYGLPGANAYLTVDDATTYHVANGNAGWASEGSSPSDALEAAIVRASSYIDRTYRARFPGSRKNGRAQGLEWPRLRAKDIYGEAIGDSEVPLEVRMATAEAALRELQAPGSLSPDYVASEKVVSERVGPLAVTYSDKLSSSGPGSTTPVVSIIDGILEPIIGAKSQVLFGPSTRA
jgi:hypothetical protein